MRRVLERTESFLSESFPFLCYFPLVKEAICLPPSAPLVVLFLITGGTELIASSYEAQEYLLLVHPSMNSLPAALELRTFLISRGKVARIYSLEELKQVLPSRFKAWQTYRRFCNSRLAMIGTPASWLVGSSLPFDQVQRRWGMEILQLDLKEMGEHYPAKGYEEESALREAPRQEIEVEDLSPPLALASSLLAFAHQNRLDGLALSCFDLLKESGIAGCLALSVLNERGITAACEGDLLSLLTMHLLSLISGNAVFMGNPSWIERDRILLTHCTVATRLVSRFVLRPHFESGKSVAIEGCLSPGPYTLAKIAPDLKGIFFALTNFVPHKQQDNLCRTQVLLQLEGAERIKQLNLANHLILTPGDWVRQLEDLTSLLGLKSLSGQE